MARPMLRIGVVLMNAGSSVFWSEKSAMTRVPPLLMAAVAPCAAGVAAAGGAAGTVGAVGAVAGPQLAAAKPLAACSVNVSSVRRVTFTCISPSFGDRSLLEPQILKARLLIGHVDPASHLRTQSDEAFTMVREHGAGDLILPHRELTVDALPLCQVGLELRRLDQPVNLGVFGDLFPQGRRTVEPAADVLGGIGPPAQEALVHPEVIVAAIGAGLIPGAILLLDVDRDVHLGQVRTNDFDNLDRDRIGPGVDGEASGLGHLSLPEERFRFRQVTGERMIRFVIERRPDVERAETNPAGIEEHRAVYGLAIQRPVERLAEWQTASVRRANGVPTPVVVARAQQTTQDDLGHLLHALDILEWQVVRDVDSARAKLDLARRIGDNRPEAHPVEGGFTRSPVVGVALEQRVVAVGILDEAERTGADGVLSIVDSGFLHGRRRNHEPAPVEQDVQQLRIRLLHSQAERVRVDDFG